MRDEVEEKDMTMVETKASLRRQLNHVIHHTFRAAIFDKSEKNKDTTSCPPCKQVTRGYLTVKTLPAFLTLDAPSKKKRSVNIFSWSCLTISLSNIFAIYAVSFFLSAVIWAVQSLMAMAMTVGGTFPPRLTARTSYPRNRLFRLTSTLKHVRTTNVIPLSSRIQIRCV